MKTMIYVIVVIVVIIITYCGHRRRDRLVLCGRLSRALLDLSAADKVIVPGSEGNPANGGDRGNRVGGGEVAKHDVRRGTYTLHVTLPRLLRNTSNNNHNDNVLIVSYRDDNNNYCAPTTLYIVVHVYPHKTPRFDVYHGHGCVSVCM